MDCDLVDKSHVSILYCVTEWPLIAKFRLQGLLDMYTLIDHILDSATLRDILKDHLKFAPRM